MMQSSSDSPNPYESPQGLDPDRPRNSSRWPFALGAALGYFCVAVLLFGILPAVGRTLLGASYHAPILDRFQGHLKETIFVGVVFAGPIAFVAALLDFAPAKRIGLIRSIAISGGIFFSIYIAIAIAMMIFDEFVPNTFVANRNTYGQRSTLASSAFLGLGYLSWLIGMVALLWRRLRNPEPTDPPS